MTLSAKYYIKSLKRVKNFLRDDVKHKTLVHKKKSFESPLVLPSA